MNRKPPANFIARKISLHPKLKVAGGVLSKRHRPFVGYFGKDDVFITIFIASLNLSRICFD
jgi:hypothetical protein